MCSRSPERSVDDKFVLPRFFCFELAIERPSSPSYTLIVRSSSSNSNSDESESESESESELESESEALFFLFLPVLPFFDLFFVLRLYLCVLC